MRRGPRRLLGLGAVGLAAAAAAWGWRRLQVAAPAGSFDAWPAVAPAPAQRNGR